MTNTINLTPLFEAVIALIAALISAKLIPWIRAKTTQQQQANMLAVVQGLVFAAEGLYGANKGAEKLKWVAEELEKRGFVVDTAMIERCVYESLNKWRFSVVDLADPDTETAKSGETEEE